MYKKYRYVQNKAIKKYGTKFTPHKFYSNIAQNKTYIDILNNVLKKYQLYIDYYPRILDKKKKWIIDTIYLPIYITEPSR